MDKAVAILREGGLVVFPTETSYGIACDSANAAAVARVFAAKGRDEGKGLPLIAADAAMAERWARLTPRLRQLAREHWPGPLTVVAAPRRKLPPGVVSPDGTVAIRVSAHPAARLLAKRLGRPIVATSANRSGNPACFSINSAKKALGASVDLYLDGGRLARRSASTIVAERDGELVVLRQGPIRL